MQIKGPEIEYEYDNTIVRLEPVTKSTRYKLIKRTIDILGALIGLLLMTIILILLSPFYFFGSHRGPVFFKQQRIGQYGEVFEIYKFRSMVKNAEHILRQNEVLYKKYVAKNYKLEPDEDPRITPFGKFIRKTSLDEFPQFINVLKGEMSLIGPRPLVNEELIEYQENQELFLSAKPGITGYWQTCGRSGIDYPERVNFELYYIYHQCIVLDIQILFKTIKQVLIRKGAY